MKKKIISILIRLLISTLLIIILLYIMRNKYGEILSALKGTDLALFAAGFLAFIAAVVVASYRLMLIIEAQEDIPIKFDEAASLTFIGYFFNNFLPTSIGGDVVKAYYLSRKTVGKLSSFTSVFVDRAIGLITMMLMAFIALFFVENSVVDSAARNAIYLITFLSLAAVVFISNKNVAKKFSVLLKLVKPLEDKLIAAYNGIHKYRHHTALMLQSVAISVVSQLLFFLSIGFLAYSIGARISPMNILLMMPLISMMSLLPSINGLGLREGTMVVLFGPLMGKPNAFAVSILWLLVLIMTSMIGGIVYMLSPQFRINLREIKE